MMQRNSFRSTTVAWAAMACAFLLVLGASPVLSQPSAADVERSLQKLADATAGQARVSINKATGMASFVRVPAAAAKSMVAGATFEAKAASFLEQHGGAFGVENAARDLVPLGTETRGIFTHVRYAQVYRGVPVFGGMLAAHFDRDGDLVAFNGSFIPGLALDVDPVWSAGDATEIAIGDVRGADKALQGLFAADARLYVYRAGLFQRVAGPNHLVWEVEVVNQERTVREFRYVDAHFGKVVERITGIHEALDREVSETTLANVIWDESAGDPDPIPPGWAGGTAQQIIDWNDEIDGAKETYNVVGSMTGGTYLSYDGAMATMRTVNNDPTINCPNANWNGTSTNYCTGVTGDDTVAHEWGHAYTQHTSNLVYLWQSGALNESFSDIMGEVIDLVNGRGTDSPGGLRTDGSCSTFGAGLPSVDNSYRWLSGEDDPAFGGAIRDMWHPNCYNDPGMVSDSQYECTTFDGGGVHINSGVPNRAFALMVDGSAGAGVTGIGLTKAARIEWEALNLLTLDSGFVENADALEAACTALIGATLYDLDATDPTGTPSAQVITAGDCLEVTAAIAAVEMRFDPTPQCNFQPLLAQSPPALCGGNPQNTIHSQDWELGLGSWTVGTRDVVNPATFDTPDWAVITPLPGGEPGSGAFVEDNQDLGDCVTDIEAGVLFLESPVISIPAGASAQLAFDHWVATEIGWDGGNLSASVNGGTYALIPSSAFTYNAYNGTLNTAGAGNDNPLAGQPAFTGTDEGFVKATWGQSQVDLSGIAAGGDDVQLRFEMGLDGCAGVIGWAVDEVEVYSCPGVCGNGLLDPGENCDDGNSVSGDGCSDTCQVEPGWTCTPPIPPVPPVNVMADGSFEAGTPNPSWAEASTNFGSPICSQALCGGPVPSDGLWHVWFGGISVYEAGSVEQSVVIPATATTIDFDLTVGVCDSLNDYMDLEIDGNQEFTTDPCTAGPPATESVNIGAYADGAAHTVRFTSETFATGGGNSNFFLDNVVLSDNGTPGTPSICTMGCTQDDGPTWGKWNLPPNGGSHFGISAVLESPPGTQVYYFRADLTDTGGGGTIVGTLHAGSVIPAYDVVGTYVDTPSTSASIRNGTFAARIFTVGTTTTVGKIGGRWKDRVSVNSIGKYRGEWKICD